MRSMVPTCLSVGKNNFLTLALRKQSRRGPPRGGRDPKGMPPGMGGRDPRGMPPGIGGRDPRGMPPGFGGDGRDPRGMPPGFGGDGRDPRGMPPGFGGDGRDPRGMPPGFGGDGRDPRGMPPGFGGDRRDPRGMPSGFGGDGRDPRGMPPGFGGDGRDPRGMPPGFGGDGRGVSAGAGNEGLEDPSSSSPPTPPEPPKRPDGKPEFLLVEEREDGVTVLSLNTGKANILHQKALNEFLSWIHYLGNTDSCKGLILRSELEGIFSSGFDLKEFLNAETFETFWTSVQECWMLMTSFPKTLIAEINGHAVGGGCVLTLAADYRIMLQGKGKIGLPESTFGLTVPPWIINHWCTIVGPRTGERMLQLGEVVDARCANAIGLVDEVVESTAELRSAGEAALKRFLAVPEQGKWMTKDMARRELFRFLADESDRRYDLEFFSKLVQHPDVRSAITSHYDKISSKPQKGPESA